MNDPIHGKVRSIYDRTDYIVNSDQSINRALAWSWQYGIVTEAAARPGLYRQNRLPAYSPLVLAPGSFPAAKARNFNG